MPMPMPVRIPEKLVVREKEVKEVWDVLLALLDYLDLKVEKKGVIIKRKR